MGTTKTRKDNMKKLRRYTLNDKWNYDHLVAVICINFDVSIRTAREYLKILIDIKHVRLDKKSRKIIPVKWKEQK